MTSDSANDCCCGERNAEHADALTHDRRDFLTKAVVGAGVAGAAWAAPSVVSSRAYAQGSCAPCASSTFTVLAAGVRDASGAPWAGTTVSVCIPDDATQVDVVATGNNASHAGNPDGLEFDESVTFAVTQPTGASASLSLTSWQDCAGGSISVPRFVNQFDISSLFQDAGGAFVCGFHTIVLTQCNSAPPSSVRSFDIVVS